MRTFVQVFGLLTSIIFLLQAVLAVDFPNPEIASSHGSTKGGSSSGMEGGSSGYGQGKPGMSSGYGRSGGGSTHGGSSNVAGNGVGGGHK